MKAKKEDWVNQKWRPAMGWMYMAVCIFDFVLFPIMFTMVQFWEQEAANDAFRQWQPLTLIGGGLFHMAMGVVLGITSWSRGQEKISGVAGGASSTPMIANPGYTNVGYQSPPAPFIQERTFDTVSPVTTGYKGKKAPPEPSYPEI